MNLNKNEISQWFMQLQDSICSSLEALDTKYFQEDKWERKGGGGGRSRILENGDVFEKGGVNFSAVHGATPEKILQALKLDSSDFYATGVSIVIHPRSPRVPIIHMNVRYFEMSNGINWFGGGIDLTPHYIVPEDARFFHQMLKDTCDRHHPDYYPEFKKWADDYFYIKHRKETRGVGGVFFDRLNETSQISIEERFEFVKDVGQTFIPVYTELVKRNKDISYGEKELLWQRLRRGRYVEFNLVLDKGTKFGLDTDGRTESILMSLPPMASWNYNHQVPETSDESYTQSNLLKGIDWLKHI